MILKIAAVVHSRWIQRTICQCPFLWINDSPAEWQRDSETSDILHFIWQWSTGLSLGSNPVPDIITLIWLNNYHTLTSQFFSFNPFSYRKRQKKKKSLSILPNILAFSLFSLSHFDFCMEHSAEAKWLPIFCSFPRFSKLLYIRNETMKGNLSNWWWL